MLNERKMVRKVVEFIEFHYLLLKVREYAQWQNQPLCMLCRFSFRAEMSHLFACSLRENV